MKPTFDRERQVAIEAVRQAAHLCIRVQKRRGSFLTKADASPVTVADFGSQALICRTLMESFPDDPILGEEDWSMLARPENRAVLDEALREVQISVPDAHAADLQRWIGTRRARPGNRVWVLDPVDGTRGFIRGSQYAIALALIVDGRIEVSALGCPNLDDGVIFAAVRGQGSVRISGETETIIHVNDLYDPSQARYCESAEASHTVCEVSARIAAALGIRHPPLKFDSQVKYALVASGQAELLLRASRKDELRQSIWDHAPGVLILTEAGGKVTDFTGAPLDFRGDTVTARRGLVATNGVLHERVLQAIAAVGLV